MNVNPVSFESTGAFTPFFLDYIRQKESLKSFYNTFPELKNFADQLAQKQSFPAGNRNILVQVLQKQYTHVSAAQAVKNNISNLGNTKTFTITTGHQLNIFTGPLYFIYKIVTVINACKKLSAAYPDYRFVPVYWMASEDHDYDEIKSFRLYGKNYTWHTSQQGAVGRFTTHDLKTLFSEIPGDITLFKEAYTRFKKLSDAVRYYVNALFGEYGLVAIDGDDHELKKLFSPVISDDLFNHSAKRLVDQTNSNLEKLGYKPQVFCREVNLFYLDDGLRSRIEKSGDRYTVIDTALSFTKAEIEKLVQQSPEKFSPNVCLRPLYQEMILPNLAYVGGPAELVYWLQFKSMFDYYNVPFPVLLPRNFALVINAPQFRKFQKTGIELTDLFKEKSTLLNQTALKFSSNKIQLNGEKEAIVNQFNAIKNHATFLDKTLEPMVAAETKRAINSLEKIEQKLLRAEKRRQADRLRQVEELKDALFPNGSLQERTDNFLNFYQTDPQFIHKLVQHFDPFDFRFNILAEND
ncbi:MAG: bacillithiol biosynthesis cysteine-adding enzyme BshC [Flammeovirgaceae bacterium]|nr:MAG: bacillithiol biosynthesis cysteine-adding enzyme BshC [Flammeovirgaceae bacterium]